MAKREIEGEEKKEDRTRWTNIIKPQDWGKNTQENTEGVKEKIKVVESTHYKYLFPGKKS